ncbi:MAG: DUF6502 family protein [Nitrospiraceae bacterium]
MAQFKHRQALSAAIGHPLRPLVRILLRNNVSHRTFAELAKRVYVEVANTEFGIAGKKQLYRELRILSGLMRKEVQRLMMPPADSNSIPDEEYHRASRAVTGRIRDLHFEMEASLSSSGMDGKAHHSSSW